MLTKILYKLISISFICIVSICFGCAPRQKEYRAYIDRSHDWQMIESCGYEGCYPMVDVLTGNDMRLRFDFYKVKNGQLVFFKLMFIDAEDGLIFTPENITVTLGSHEELQVKVFKCSYPIWDLSIFRSTPSINGPIYPNKSDCYLLFVDYQELDQSRKSIAMDINKAFTLHGIQMNIPIIYFKRNQDYKK